MNSQHGVADDGNPDLSCSRPRRTSMDPDCADLPRADPLPSRRSSHKVGTIVRSEQSAAGRPARGRTGHALASLRGDPPGRVQQLDQVIDRPPQPAPAPARRSARWALATSRSASRAACSAGPASSPVIRRTVACASSRQAAVRRRIFAAMQCTRLPAARDRSRTLVRVALPAAWIRRPVAAIRRTALASSPGWWVFLWCGWIGGSCYRNSVGDSAFRGSRRLPVGADDRAGPGGAAARR